MALLATPSNGQLDGLDGKVRDALKFCLDSRKGKVDIFHDVASKANQVMVLTTVGVKASSSQTKIQRVYLAHLNKFAQGLVDRLQRYRWHLSAEMGKYPICTGVIPVAVQDLKDPLTLRGYLFAVGPEAIYQLCWTSHLPRTLSVNNHLLMLVIVGRLRAWEGLVGAATQRLIAAPVERILRPTSLQSPILPAKLPRGKNSRVTLKLRITKETLNLPAIPFGHRRDLGVTRASRATSSPALLSRVDAKCGPQLPRDVVDAGTATSQHRCVSRRNY